MMEILDERSLERISENVINEQTLLKEIEDSFCVAGFDIIDTKVFKEKIKEEKGKLKRA